MNVFAGVGGWAAGWLLDGCFSVGLVLDGLPDSCWVGVFLLGGRFPSVALAPPAGLGN